jgi:hypothetical protein
VGIELFHAETNYPADITKLTSCLGGSAKLRKATAGFVMSVRPSAWNNSALSGLIVMKFAFRIFFYKNLSRKITFHKYLTRIIGTLYEDLTSYLCR